MDNVLNAPVQFTITSFIAGEISREQPIIIVSINAVYIT